MTPHHEPKCYIAVCRPMQSKGSWQSSGAAPGSPAARLHGWLHGNSWQQKGRGPRTATARSASAVVQLAHGLIPVGRPLCQHQASPWPRAVASMLRLGMQLLCALRASACIPCTMHVSAGTGVTQQQPQTGCRPVPHTINTRVVSCLPRSAAGSWPAGSCRMPCVASTPAAAAAAAAAAGVLSCSSTWLSCQGCISS